jgi:hypothetical protein
VKRAVSLVKKASKILQWLTRNFSFESVKLKYQMLHNKETGMKASESRWEKSYLKKTQFINI